MTQSATPTRIVIGRDDGGAVIYSPLIDSNQTDGQGNHLLYQPRISIAKAQDVSGFGAYQFSVISGAMAINLGAGSPVFSFRCGALSLIKQVFVAMWSTGTGFTAGIGRFDLFVARAFSASDTGGNPVTLTGNNNKLRTLFATTAVANAQIANTGTLTAGTRTLDGNALTQVAFAVSTALNTVMLPTTNILNRDPGDADWPLVCAANEGFVIQATVPATGTWAFQVAVDWQEALVY